MKEKLQYISNNLKMYRTRIGYTQEKVAKILNVSRATYCDYEVNPQKLKIETLQDIANIFKCDLKDFFVQFEVTESNIDNQNTNNN